MHGKRIGNLFFILSVLCISPLLFLLNRRGRSKRAEKLRILVIPQLSRIGDIVCSTPVFRSIKIKYPESYIAVLSSKKARGIIQNNPRIDEIISVGDYGLWDLAKKIRGEQFDWSIDLTGVSTISALTLAGDVPDRIKLTRTPRPITELLTDWMSNHQFLYVHRAFLPGHYLKMLKPLGIVDQPLVKEVFESKTGPQAVADFCAARGIKRNDLVIGMNLTAGNKIKEWGNERFAELIRMISEKYAATIIVIGAKSDESRINEVIRTTKRQSVFSAIGFSLEDLPSLMKRFNLFIAVDTGPMYIAHALQVPLIDIIGPVDPLSQPPEDEISVQVRPPAHISPSSWVFRKPGSPSEHKRAIDSISVRDVFEAVERLLDTVYHR